MEIDLSPVRDFIRASQHDEEEGDVKSKASLTKKIQCLRFNEWNFPCCHVRCGEFSASTISWNCAIGAGLSCVAVGAVVVINQLANAALGC